MFGILEIYTRLLGNIYPMSWIYISSASDLYIQHIGYTSPINGVNISFVFDK